MITVPLAAIVCLESSRRGQYNYTNAVLHSKGSRGRLAAEILTASASAGSHWDGVES